MSDISTCRNCDAPIPANCRVDNDNHTEVYCPRCGQGWKYFQTGYGLHSEPLTVTERLAWRQLAGMLAAAPQPAPTVTPPAPALHHNEWQILTVLAGQAKVAMTQADIGENTDPKLSPQTVARWLKRLRERGLTEPLNSGGECITAKGLDLVRGHKD